MKLMHIRRFGTETFVSVNHYSHKDPLATKLAKAIRSQTGASARVIHDASGITHVFVARNAEAQARDIALRGEFN